MKKVKLYGYATSPYVRKTACFLYYKEIEFTHVPVDPTDPEATLAHTDGTQVPVLEIDGEHRRESSHHAAWLDELFPKKPLCPRTARANIERIDQWISDTYLRSTFRFAIDGDNTLQYKFRAWRLAALVSAHTPLPEKIRHNWPEGLRRAPFIQNMAQGMDMSESHQNMQQRIAHELVDHIGRGPFLGELDKPTMLDLAVFPQLVFGYMFGLEESLSAAQLPVLKSWMYRVAQHLPENPTLCADELQINALADGLT